MDLSKYTKIQLLEDEHYFELIDDFLRLGAEGGADANTFANELQEKMQFGNFSDLSDREKEIYHLIRKLQFQTINLLSEKEILAFFKENLAKYIGNDQDQIFIREYLARKMVQLDFDERDAFKADIRKMLESSDQLLTQVSIQSTQGGARRGTVGNWIRDYISTVGTGEVSSIKKADYFRVNPTIRTLDANERRKVVNLLEFYQYLKYPSDSPEGIDEILFATDPRGHTLRYAHGKAYDIDLGQEIPLTKFTESYVSDYVDTTSGSAQDAQAQREQAQRRKVQEIINKPNQDQKLAGVEHNVSAKNVTKSQSTPSRKPGQKGENLGGVYEEDPIDKASRREAIVNAPKNVARSATQIAQLYKGSPEEQNELKVAAARIENESADKKKSILDILDEVLHPRSGYNADKTQAVAALRLLTQQKRLEELLTKGKLAGEFQNYLKKNNPDAAKGYEIQPTTPYYLRLMLQYIFQEKLGLDKNESARLGMQIGSVAKKVGMDKYSTIAYYDMQEGSFVWS